MLKWPDLTFPPINLWSLPKQQKDYDMMQISLYDTNGDFTITLHDNFEQLEEYIELLVKPILRAAGFGEASLDKYFVKEEPYTVAYSEFELEPVEKKVVDKVAKKYYE